MIELEHDAPDLEDLAAYIDGRLVGERKAQVEERLLHDEDYYDVFRENVEFLQEHGLQEVDDAEVVRPTAWRQSWKVTTPLAIAATLVAAVGLWQLNREPTAGDWVARLDAKEIVSQEGWDQPGLITLRGNNIDQGRYGSEEIAFRIGLRTVELRTALAAEHRSAASNLAYLLGELANKADLFVESAAYRNLYDQIADAEFATLIERAADIEVLLAESFEANPLEARGFALGVWAEAGRLAALAGDARVLSDVLQRRHEAKTVDRLTPQLEELEAIVARDNFDETDFEAARMAFSKIARALAGRG